MTIPEHIEILRRGPRVWNAWRAENPSIVPDLAGIALSIGDRQMGPINGGPINLSRALLNEATLYYATLTGADMRGSDLTNADLRGARLEGVDLTGADLAGAQLDGASLAGAVLKAANLSGASLADVRDLTTDQIGEAEGNLGTVLPYDLERPAIWSVGQGVLHIETAQEAAERDAATRGAYDRTASETPAAPEEYVEPEEYAGPEAYGEAQESFKPEGHIEPEEHVEPDVTYAAEPELPQEEIVADPVDETPPEVAPDEGRQAEMPAFSQAPALPRVEAAARPQPPHQPKPSVQPMSMGSSMGSNGHANGFASQNTEQADSDDKHVSWLVGGPRRSGRPTRNWRDRA